MNNNEIINTLRAAEFHWHFIQGIEALNANMYVPGIASLLNGIEASIRVTLNQVNGENIQEADSLGAVLSNSLLRKAFDLGLPINSLAFPEEADYSIKLQNKKTPVEIVRIRNNICHGNIIEYIQDSGAGMIFTPECLKEVSDNVKTTAFVWVKELGDFRRIKLGF